MFKTTSKLQLVCMLGSMSIASAQRPVETSLAQASEDARKTSNGKVLSAKTTVVNGRKIHRIQTIAPSGRVKIFKVPANKQNNRTPRNQSRTQNNNTHQSQPYKENTTTPRRNEK